MQRLISVLLVCTLLPAMAQDRVMTPQDVAKMQSVGTADMSPNGDRVAYTVSVPRKLFQEKDGSAWRELHLWDAERGSRVYIGGEVRIGSVSFSTDGQLVAYLAKRHDDKQTKLYVIPVDGGESRTLVEHETSIANYDWSDDARWVVFTAREKEADNPLADQGFDQEIFEEELPRNVVWLQDVNNRDAEPTLLEVPGHAVSANLSPDASRAAVVASPTSLIDQIYMDKTIYIMDTASGEQVSVIDPPGKFDSPHWSPDGTQLAFLAGADRNDPNAGRLYVVDVASGNVTKHFLEDEADITTVTWLDSQTIMYLWDEGVYTSLRTKNLKSGAVTVHLPNGGPAFRSISVSANGNKVALVGSTPRHPAEVFVWNKGAKSAEKVTDHNAWLGEIKMGKQEVVTYEARDGLELEGILIYPTDYQEGKKYPLVMTVHGGPEAHQSNGWLTSYSSLGQVAAGMDMAVFYPNYRASTGRGVKFSQLDHGRPAMEEFDDLVDAIPHLADTMGVVDKQKVGVTGGSYGGYATAWCATKHSEHFAAGVMFVGISNKISKSGTSDIPEELYQVHDRMEVWENWQMFLEQSPIYHVENAKTPLLIMHGKEDTRVPPSQSKELYRHMKRLDQTPVRLVYYPDEGHGNRRAASRYDYNLRALRWFSHYLQGAGGDPPPATVDYEVEGEPKDGAP